MRLFLSEAEGEGSLAVPRSSEDGMEQAPNIVPTLVDELHSILHRAGLGSLMGTLKHSNDGLERLMVSFANITMALLSGRNPSTLLESSSHEGRGEILVGNTQAGGIESVEVCRV